MSTKTYDQCVAEGREVKVAELGARRRLEDLAFAVDTGTRPFEPCVDEGIEAVADEHEAQKALATLASAVEAQYGPEAVERFRSEIEPTPDEQTALEWKWTAERLTQAIRDAAEKYWSLYMSLHGIGRNGGGVDDIPEGIMDEITAAGDALHLLLAEAYRRRIWSVAYETWDEYLADEFDEYDRLAYRVIQDGGAVRLTPEEVQQGWDEQQVDRLIAREYDKKPDSTQREVAERVARLIEPMNIPIDVDSLWRYYVREHVARKREGKSWA